MLFLLLACADGTVTWAVNHASITPTGTGFTGTQTWEFFDATWEPAAGDQGYVCSRAQLLEGTVASGPECADCDHLFRVSVEEFQGDCDGAESTSESFSTPRAVGLGGVGSAYEADDPHPGQSMGWYASWDGQAMSAWGWAYDEALDAEAPGAIPPGWVEGRNYTLWPGNAWDLR